MWSWLDRGELVGWVSMEFRREVRGSFFLGWAGRGEEEGESVLSRFVRYFWSFGIFNIFFDVFWEVIVEIYMRVIFF